MRSDLKDVYPGILKEEEEFRPDSWIQIISGGWRETKCKSSTFLARKPPAFHCRMLRVFKGGEGMGFAGRDLSSSGEGEHGREEADAG